MKVTFRRVRMGNDTRVCIVVFVQFEWEKTLFADL